MYRFKFVENFTSTRSALIFDIFYGFRDIRVQRSAKITPVPKLGGNNGPIVLGYGRFSIRGQLQHTLKFLSKSVSSFERYPLTNFLAQTDRQTDRQTDWQTDRHTHRHAHTHTHVKINTTFLGVSVLVESGDVLTISSTSNFWRYSNTSIRSTNMEVIKTIKCQYLLNSSRYRKILKISVQRSSTFWFPVKENIFFRVYLKKNVYVKFWTLI